MAKELRIVFENDNLMILEKPAGMVTTKEGRENNTLEDYLGSKYPNQLPRNGIVHRLDKGTSGLLLVAKDKESLERLKQQFKSRKVKKRYYCLVSGEVPFEGSINLPIGRSNYSFGKFGVRVDGKKALTEFKLLKKYLKNGKKYSLLEVNLKTGRTHQIRVHLSHLRWPLVGDGLYGGEDDGLGRPFLHAYYLEIWEPKTRKKIKFDLELPEDLKDYLKTYEEI